MFRRILLMFCLTLTILPVLVSAKEPAYGTSKFITFDDINETEQLKVVFDFNFEDPSGVKRALYPVSYTMKTVQEYGPVSFDPVDAVVVSHGAEVVAFAKKNYEKYKDIIDHAARLANIGVKFLVCSIAAETLGYKPSDFHGFVSVVPTGAYAMIYYQNKGYSLMPGAATVPVDIINSYNKPYLGNRIKQ